MKATKEGVKLKELKNALRRMIGASDTVVENWSEGDLAGAVNDLESEADAARIVLEGK